MKIIGLTGMSGSGKSYVAAVFSSFGVPCINSVEVVHELYSEKNPCTLRIAELFGPSVIDEKYSVNRRTLAEIVFSDRNKLELLNRTVHPFVTEKCMQEAHKYEKKGCPLLVIEAPQLFESGLDSECDCIVSVCADAELRKARIVSRDGISSSDAEKRLSNQHDDVFFRGRSDFVIENGPGSDVRGQVMKIITSLLESDDTSL